MSIDDSAEVLYTFSKEKIGSKILVETVCDVLETQIDEKMKKNEKIDS